MSNPQYEIAANAYVLAYRLANALLDEIHYSNTPSEDSLTLLAEAVKLYPNSELADRYREFEIDKMKAVE